MSEELEREEGEQEQEQEEQGGEQTVTLPKDVYENLLAQLTEGTQASKQVLSKVEQEEQRIAQEEAEKVRSVKAGRFDTAKTPGELAAMIRESVLEDVQEMVYPVASTVMQIVVAEEVKNARAAHSDFDSYRDDIYKLTTQNTKLSIEDAYLIASGKKGGGKQASPEPKKEQKTVVGGERPTGVGRQNVTDNSPLTVKDAVRMARDKVMGGKS